jgi:ABC-type methionine transport system permease subunit
MPNDPIIIGIAVLAIAILGYTAINGMMSGGKGKDKTDKGA